MTVRLLTQQDIITVKQLDDAVRDEMLADFPLSQPLKLSTIASYITDADKRAIAYLTGGGAGTLRGFMLVANTQLPLATGHWSINRIVTDKNLTANQRITGTRDAIRFGAQQLINAGGSNALIYGVVKVGGKLDTLLSTKPYAREPWDVTHLFVPNPGGSDLPGTLSDVPLQVKFAAIASVVEATI